MTTFQRIPNDRLSDRVVEQLIQMIHAGDLPVGTKLPTETAMAQQLGVSRGILREALNILQSRGYITRYPREGTVVRQSSDRDIGNSITTQVRSAVYKDLLEFREAMECKAVEKAVALATEEEIQTLFDLIEKAEDTPATPGSIDYYFHYRLAKYSRNKLFVVFLDMYYDTIHEIARMSYQDKHRQAQARQEHMQIADAIRRRDSKAAVEAVQNHLRQVRHLIGDEPSP